jgi:hypothetical protein
VANKALKNYRKELAGIVLAAKNLIAAKIIG